MGSLSKVTLAYIAGFLDGDGSLMLQIKKRKDGKAKYRFMATICFYQDSRHEEHLHWIREVFDIGYFSKRNDGMSELRINGFEQVHNIMSKLLPFIRFKKKQALALYEATNLLSMKKQKDLTSEDLQSLVSHILAIQGENYAAKRKKTEKELRITLALTP